MLNTEHIENVLAWLKHHPEHRQTLAGPSSRACFAAVVRRHHPRSAAGQGLSLVAASRLPTLQKESHMSDNIVNFEVDCAALEMNEATGEQFLDCLDKLKDAGLIDKYWVAYGFPVQLRVRLTELGMQNRDKLNSMLPGAAPKLPPPKNHRRLPEGNAGSTPSTHGGRDRK